MPADTLAAIQKAGGSMELAGAAADSLLAPPDDDDTSNSALSAMTSWIATPKSLICTYEGAPAEKRRVNRMKTPEQIKNSAGVDEEELIRCGIRVAARQAVVAGNPRKVAVLATGEEIVVAQKDDDRKGGIGGLIAGLFGGNEVKIPKTMAEAMMGAVSVIRYGELFGAAESSPESSPFIGGPLRDPVVRDMYTMRSVRIDPTVSVTGNVVSGGDGSKSNRLAVACAASRLALGKVPSASALDLDVSLTSFDGIEVPTDEEWNAEFARVADMMSSTNDSGGGAQLFSAKFSSVPSTKRLTEWVATKWAPVILRSYDIAGIRVGARPVYVLQPDENTIEIVWQELLEFNSVTSGKMIIKIGEKGMTASRGAGDASRGFGLVSREPLPGEDILVRRLADAASQAMGKGLAVKPRLAKKHVVTAAENTVTTNVSAAAAASERAATPQPVTTDSTRPPNPGPRSTGARRSSERSRGSRSLKLDDRKSS